MSKIVHNFEQSIALLDEIPLNLHPNSVSSGVPAVHSSSAPYKKGGRNAYVLIVPHRHPNQTLGQLVLVFIYIYLSRRIDILVHPWLHHYCVKVASVGFVSKLKLTPIISPKEYVIRQVVSKRS